jgi:hypothetical protein
MSDGGTVLSPCDGPQWYWSIRAAHWHQTRMYNYFFKRRGKKPCFEPQQIVVKCLPRQMLSICHTKTPTTKILMFFGVVPSQCNIQHHFLQWQLKQNDCLATSPEHQNKKRDYTECTTRPYVFDAFTSTQQTAQAFLLVFLSRPSSSFNQHNTVMVVNNVIFSIPLLLVLPKVNPDFSVYIHFFLWGKRSSFKRPIAMKPEGPAPSVS